jgi:hypothetical protein
MSRIAKVEKSSEVGRVGYDLVATRDGTGWVFFRHGYLDSSTRLSGDDEMSEK